VAARTDPQDRLKKCGKASFADPLNDKYPIDRPDPQSTSNAQIRTIRPQVV